MSGPLADVDFGAITHHEDGRASVAVWRGHLRQLVRAFDPELPYVVMEGHCALSGSKWQQALVPLSLLSATHPQCLLVRRVCLDLLLTPAELIDLAPELRDATNGGVLMWQSSRQPRPDFYLDDKRGHARTAAMLGLDIRCVIDLPHDGETAVLTALNDDLLAQAVQRLTS